MDGRGKWIWICSESEHPVLGCSPAGREPVLIPGQGAKETSLAWCRTKFCSWWVELGTEEGPLHHLQQKQRFKGADVFISPSPLAASPEAAAAKHSSFAWGCCREQSLQGTAMKDKSFGGEGENETKAQSWNHKDTHGTHLWMHNPSHPSRACPQHQITPSSCPVSSPWLHPVAAQLQAAGWGMFPLGSGVHWPHLPARQSWAFRGEQELAQGSFPSPAAAEEHTRVSPHLQHWHEFLTPLFTQAAVAFSPIHCTRCAILALRRGEIPGLIHTERAQRWGKWQCRQRERGKGKFCNQNRIGYFKMNGE